MKKFHTLFLFLILISISSSGMAAGAYKYMGDGKIKIGRGYNGGLKTITFRKENGAYQINGLKEINNLYGTDFEKSEARMSLRLIELLDYLEDTMKGNGIHIVSGYRSPTYNQGLRNKGKLAASSSLHIDAEATDIVMEGVPSKAIYDYLFKKDCCGIGYYHGKTIHIDTGPPRWWDETSSGTEKREPPLNEKIVIKTKSDFYKSGDKLGLKFSRVTDYPIGVKKAMVMICEDGKKEKKQNFEVSFLKSADDQGKGCYKLKNRKEGRTIFTVAPKLKSRDSSISCRVRAYFCDPVTEKMPEFVDSNPFYVKNSPK